MTNTQYIQPRGDTFYYIEVRNTIQLRDMKLSNLLGIKQSKPMYYNGGSYENGSIWLNECIENAQFWKTKDSVNKKLFFLKGKMNKHYNINSINREEFIEKIKNGKNYKKFIINTLEHTWYNNNTDVVAKDRTYLNNMNILKKELLYKERIEQLKIHE
jgi:hypothetical protein